MRISLFVFFLLISLISCTQTTETDTIYSNQVSDKYMITIRKPSGFNTSQDYHHVYIVDGGIGMGDYILGKSNSWKATIPATCVIIAISHTGNWHDKRNRDFIPSDLRKNSGENFGKADRFYLFLKYELIPSVEKKLPNKKDRVFIGHSLGGLFCLYTLFREDKLFNRHFALSPSIWANNYELEKIEDVFAKTHKQLNADVMLYVGGLEFLNKVLYATRNFYSTTLKRNYTGFTVKKKEFADANHFSMRKPAVDQVLASLNN